MTTITGQVQSSRPLDLHISGTPNGEVWEVPAAADTNYSSHGYFRYIGKFPPQIAAQFIHEYSRPGELILDPMCGGGTVLIEALLSGRRAVGIDVNPIAVHISRVASRCIPPSRLRVEVDDFLAKLTRDMSPHTTLPFAKSATAIRKRKRAPLNMHGHEKYFDAPTMVGLRAFFNLLPEVPSADSRDFILLGLLAVLRTISHANVKKMNLELDLEKRTRRPLLQALAGKLGRMVIINAELTRLSLGPEAEIREGAAEDTRLGDSTVDLAVVHPPYLTNTAFCEATQLQLAVLGISHLTIWKRELRARGSFLHEPNGVSKYIVGWNRILRELYRVVRPGRHCAVVVGDGQVDYTRIPIGVITMELAKDIGFQVAHVARHRINNNTGRTQSRKMRDQHIIILHK